MRVRQTAGAEVNRKGRKPERGIVLDYSRWGIARDTHANQAAEVNAIPWEQAYASRNRAKRTLRLRELDCERYGGSFIFFSCTSEGKVMRREDSSTDSKTAADTLLGCHNRRSCWL